MESQPQNPEVRIIPKTFTYAISNYKRVAAHQSQQNSRKPTNYDQSTLSTKRDQNPASFRCVFFLICKQQIITCQAKSLLQQV